MTTLYDIRRAVEIYHSANEVLGDDREVTRRLRHVVEILENIPTKDADDYHLLGLCWYEQPEVSAKADREAEAAFRKALELDPRHQYANLYLGHVLFDTKRYAEALELFTRVDAEYFIARTQSWRLAKNDELILCCRLEMDPEAVGPGAIFEICDRYESDPDAAAVPREITLCVDGLISAKQVPQNLESEYARRILAMLDRTGNLRVLYLAEALGRLTRAADR
jgi:tetratricopeptide (TPR) repeat protein